ncbi:MAG TPA: spore germination protein [Clostridia bacterium]|nr:spore germination protein [Clostridia bacterium]
MSYLRDKLKGFFLFDEPGKNEQFILKYPADSVLKDNGKADRMDREIEKKLAEAGKKPDPSDAISDDIDVNLEYMKKIYSVPVNSDIVLREFSINYRGDLVRAFIMFFDGMTDREIIDNYMLTPLMVNSIMNLQNDLADGLKDYISRQLLPHNQIKLESAYSKVIEEINFGGCVLFADGLKMAFTADVKGWEHRGVEKPNNEIVIRGPQEAFNELLRSSTAQIRKRIKDENLIVEDIIVGKVSKTPCCIVYIKNVTNDGLVDEVKHRLDNIRVDYMLDSGILEQLIEDSTIFPSPQMISTERPDYVSELLVSGRVAIIVNGSPNVLVVPITMFDLLHSAEDLYIRYPYVNLLRFIRYAALTLALLLPGLYLAIITYHQEMIPTDLLLAIEASREKVPFPSIVEILLMELSFELIREAGVRVPGPIGPTLGIIGALILGQAAVAANIVSPILIIIVAVTGIGSFAIPNYSQAYSIRIMRFLFIMFGGLAGFLGITLGLFLLGVWSTSLKTFGVPFMAPIGPRTSMSYKNMIFRAPEWKREERPDYLNAKKSRIQAKYSMGWKSGRRGSK